MSTLYDPNGPDGCYFRDPGIADEISRNMEAAIALCGPNDTKIVEDLNNDKYDSAKDRAGPNHPAIEHIKALLPYEEPWSPVTGDFSDVLEHY